MSLWSAVSGMVLFLSVVLGCTAEVPGVARIACDESIYRYGAVDNRKTVERDFVVRNRGGADLVISKLWSGCGCATISAASTNIAPGGSMTVHVKIALQGRSGEQNKSFYVHSNDPTQAVLRLEMKGSAVPWLEVTPERLDFGNLDEGARETRDACVTWSAGQRFAVTNVRASLPQFFVETNAPPPGKSCRITVGTVPPLPRGVTRGVVVALTDDPSMPRFEIPIVAMVLSDIVIVPAELAVGPAKGGWAASRYVALRSRTGRAFKILSVEPPDPGIDCVVTAMGSMGYRIELKARELASDLAGTEVKIRTDLPGAEELVIPIKRSAVGQ